MTDWYWPRAWVPPSTKNPHSSKHVPQFERKARRAAWGAAWWLLVELMHDAEDLAEQIEREQSGYK